MPIKYAILSCSLSSGSLSRIMAGSMDEYLRGQGRETTLVDLRDLPLPACDGEVCYEDANVKWLTEVLEAARGVIVASPIYNFDVNSVTKNIIELTGKRAWSNTVAGFICAAGGRSSYMAPMSLANNLMLDFRTVIIPRFVYTNKSEFADGRISTPELEGRLRELGGELIRFSEALMPASSQGPAG